MDYTKVDLLIVVVLQQHHQLSFVIVWRVVHWEVDPLKFFLYIDLLLSLEVERLKLTLKTLGWGRSADNCFILTIAYSQEDSARNAWDQHVLIRCLFLLEVEVWLVFFLPSVLLFSEETGGLVAYQEIHFTWVEHVLALRITQTTSFLFEIGELSEVVKDFGFEFLTHPLIIVRIIVHSDMDFLFYLSDHLVHSHKDASDSRGFCKVGLVSSQVSHQLNLIWLSLGWPYLDFLNLLLLLLHVLDHSLHLLLQIHCLVC